MSSSVPVSESSTPASPSVDISTSLLPTSTTLPSPTSSSEAVATVSSDAPPEPSSSSTPSEPSSSSIQMSSSEVQPPTSSQEPPTSSSSPPTPTSSVTTESSSTPPTTSDSPPITSSEPPPTTTTSDPTTSSVEPPTTSIAVPPTSTLIPPTSTVDPGPTTTVPAPTTVITAPGQTVTRIQSVAPGVIVTQLQSTVFIVTTNAAGVTITTAPPQITTTLVTTLTNGQVVTQTIVGTNNPDPSLSSDEGGTTRGFFRNTGAVAAVFVIVGLACLSLVLFVFFFLRKKRKTQKLEHDTAVSATLAAAGYNRSPLDDGEVVKDRSRSRFGSTDLEMNQRSSSHLAGASRAPSALGGNMRTSASPPGSPGFAPYADYPPTGQGRDRATSPPSAFPGGLRDSSGTEHSMQGHGHNGSFEPLLAGYYRKSQSPSPKSPPTPPPRHPDRPSTGGTSTGVVDRPSAQRRSSATSSVYSDESVADDRLDPLMRTRRTPEGSDLRDDEDYSRPVLGVRNIPDGASLKSRDS